MTDRSYIEQMSALPDNNAGLVGPVDLRAMVDMNRESNVNEAFLFTTNSAGLAVPLSNWEVTAPSAGNPAYAWVRSRAVGSVADGAIKFSHFDGLLNTTASISGN